MLCACNQPNWLVWFITIIGPNSLDWGAGQMMNNKVQRSSLKRSNCVEGTYRFIFKNIFNLQNEVWKSRTLDIFWGYYYVLQWKPLNVITNNVIIMLMGSNWPSFVKSQIILNIIGEADLLIVIIWIMLSFSVCPKVITLICFYCT